MGNTSGMKILVRDIASSREDRVKMLQETEAEAKKLREEAQGLVEGFHAARRQTGVQLRKDLAEETARTKSGVKRVLGDAQGLVKDFRASRRKESARMRRQLANGAARRRAEAGEIQKDAQQTLGSFRSRRKEMSSELREGLSQSRVSSKGEVGQLLENAQGLVKDFQEARKETGDRLRKVLARGRAVRESEVKEMRRDFGKVRAGVRDDLKEAAAVWKELATGGDKGRAKVTVAEEEIPDLEAKLLAAINEHTGGITLTEVADSLGVAPIVLGRAVRGLLDRGKVRKEDRLYFPLAGE